MRSCGCSPRCDRARTVIRRARPDDARKLAALAERTFRAAFASQNTPENMDLHCASHYGTDIQAQEIEAPELETFVVEGDGELIAYGQLRWDGAPSFVRGSKPAEILRFYVDQSWHGRGVAHALMNELLENAKTARADSVWLGVWEQNPRAIAFYHKWGFTEAGHQVFAVGTDPQRDLVLVRRLD